MEDSQILRGMSTVSFWADDVKEARKWYTRLLGIEPYFQQPDSENPDYIEFRIGDYHHELGIINNQYAPKGPATKPGGAVIFWHVDNIQATFEQLISMGAKEYEPITNRSEGFVTASVTDPFGNILGIMYNPHYLEILEKLRAANQER